MCICNTVNEGILSVSSETRSQLGLVNRNLTLSGMSGLTAAEMRAKLEEYDKDLKILSDISGKMVENAEKINKELKDQLENIKDLIGDMDTAQTGIDGARDGMANVTEQNEKANKAMYISWGLSVLFLIAIFIVQFVWHPEKNK